MQLKHLNQAMHFFPSSQVGRCRGDIGGVGGGIGEIYARCTGDVRESDALLPEQPGDAYP